MKKELKHARTVRNFFKPFETYVYCISPIATNLAFGSTNIVDSVPALYDQIYKLNHSLHNPVFNELKGR